MPAEPRIVAVGTANPPRRYSQREIYDLSTRHIPFYKSPRIEQIFMSSDIDHRHLAFDIETFTPETADQLHERFAEHSVRVGRDAILKCFAAAGMSAQDVDYFVAVSCTGYLCPGLSSLLIKDLGMRNNVQRADLLGMGCAGAMPGLQRAHDFVKAYPDRTALVLTVEICSACYYIEEDLETVVGNAICGDGAAAALVMDGHPTGDGASAGPTASGDGASPGPVIVAFDTLLEPAYIDTVGFQFRSGKLRIVLSKDIRDVAGGLAWTLISRLLKEQGLTRADIHHWVIHSGGRKVIDSVKAETGLKEEQLVHSRSVLRDFGNMSSPTVMFVLDEVHRKARPRPGELGVMLAMGPGLAVEAALLRW
jgi:alkylresorcinol/alkylpyrone synthase/polyketide synthase Type III